MNHQIQKTLNEITKKANFLQHAQSDLDTKYEAYTLNTKDPNKIAEYNAIYTSHSQTKEEQAFVDMSKSYANIRKAGYSPEETVKKLKTNLATRHQENQKENTNNATQHFLNKGFEINKEALKQIEEFVTSDPKTADTKINAELDKIGQRQSSKNELNLKIVSSQ